MEVELPRTTAREIRSKSHLVSLGSPDVSADKLPIRFRVRRVRGPIAPDVSTAIGSNRYLSVRGLYFSILRSSARLAAAPGSIAESTMLPPEKVSVHVASHMSDLPPRKGKMVIPSGRLPSPRSRPTGSRCEGKPAPFKLLLRVSLRAACLGKRPALLRQDKGCRSNSSTLI